MGGFGDGLLNNIVQNSVFDQISTYILLCCTQMKIDLKNESRLIPNDENKIRNYLVEHYLDDNVWRRNNNMMMFRFDSETPENYNDKLIKYEGRVDIKIMNQIDSFSDRSAAYFVECKRLDGKKHLNDEYVKNGIKRFVVAPTRYSSFYRKNFMLGFLVVSMDLEKNIQKINEIQNKNKQINNLNQILPVENEDSKTYDCIYMVEDKKIELRHIFADFSNEIVSS